jgi:spectinomycin phosphotransferase
MGFGQHRNSLIRFVVGHQCLVHAVADFGGDASGGLVLIDWDTVALAPPERDLWMVATPGGSELDQYAEATGHGVDENALEVYRRAWDLADVAAWIRLFRSDHRQDPDTDEAWALLTQADCLG